MNQNLPDQGKCQHYWKEVPIVGDRKMAVACRICYKFASLEEEKLFREIIHIKFVENSTRLSLIVSALAFLLSAVSLITVLLKD